MFWSKIFLDSRSLWRDSQKISSSSNRASFSFAIFQLIEPLSLSGLQFSYKIQIQDQEVRESKAVFLLIQIQHSPHRGTFSESLKFLAMSQSYRFLFSSWSWELGFPSSTMDTSTLTFVTCNYPSFVFSYWIWVSACLTICNYLVLLK